MTGAGRKLAGGMRTAHTVAARPLERTTPNGKASHPVAVRLGTRGSALARWQAEWVAERLRSFGVDVQLVVIRTQGDVRAEPLGTLTAPGLFTKEIQTALLAQEIDLAVHSLKDLPTQPIDGLDLAAVPPRESANDVLVGVPGQTLDTLPGGSRVGTGSMRRRAQLGHQRPDLQCVDIRGNVDTRLARLDEGKYDALVLAAAGLRRLGRSDRITQILPFDIMLPAAGQGALGLEIRADDAATRRRVELLDDWETHVAVRAERELLALLHAGCQAPLGVFAQVERNRLRIDAVVLSPDGRHRLPAHAAGTAHAPESLARIVADELLAQGAEPLIAACR